MARPRGTKKQNSLIFGDITLGLPPEDWEWYKAIPKGTKAKVLRAAIALYRDHIKRLGDRG